MNQQRYWRPLLFLLTFSSTSSILGAANIDRPIVEEYKVIQIVSIGDGPAQIGLLRIEDSKKIRTKAGQTIDGYKIIGIENIGDEIFVVTEKSGKEYLFSLKRPDEHPFPSGPLLESFKAGLIKEDGMLTPEGKKKILNNLRQLASGADQYFLENGKTEVDAKQVIETYFKDKNIPVVAGENYKDLHITTQNNAITVKTAFGETVSIPF